MSDVAGKPEVDEIDPLQASRRQQQGGRVIDVREPTEFALGAVLGSVNIPLAQLRERLPASESPVAGEILLICASGQRSAVACARLREQGHRRVASVKGGMEAWKTAGLPVSTVALDDDAMSRYARQLVLPEIGIEGQQRLSRSRVLIVGAGGLGSPIALYLAAAGVGTLRIVDPDRVETSNLHRQILHGDRDIGTTKVESAARSIAALNPRVNMEQHACALGPDNAIDLARDADVLVDGADNFAAREHLNRAAIELRKPNVYGAVHQFEGQASVFWPTRPGLPGPCYRCLFPESPPPELAPNCATAGVLGVVPGIIGLIQANETLKILLGFGETLCGRLLTFDARRMRFRDIAISRDPECRACGSCAGP